MEWVLNLQIVDVFDDLYGLRINLYNKISKVAKAKDSLNDSGHFTFNLATDRTLR
jgi:hypothetical protein